ncbi:MAG TPA: cupredoxin domain-containing protein [Casimicrobiaceae bacterium]
MLSMRIPTLILASGILLAALPASAEDTDFSLIIRGHKFVPAEITVPARKKIKLVIENQDATAEEFESHELNREKVVPPKGKITIFVGPLEPGRYPFFGEFHKETAKGVLIAK